MQKTKLLYTVAILSLGQTATLPSALAADGVDAPVVCSIPDPIQARTELRLRRMLNAAAGNPFALDFFLEGKLQRWKPGQSVRVAFRGGTKELHKSVADVAVQWTKVKDSNLKFDFGIDSSTGKYREWSPSDQQYKAEIRIGFDQGGYWSTVGNDSIDPAICGPGSASMNFGGFDQQLPSEWEATVLHEFGHALGYQHEHQHPVGGCDTEFRWEDDPGYVATVDQFGQFKQDANGRRPGIYTVLGGPPNNWPKNKVDHNLRQIPNSSAFELSGFDGSSIMKYYFPPWMFRTATSHCVTGRNTTLSAKDKEGMAKAYPAKAEDVQNALMTSRGALESILKSERLEPAAKQRLQSQLKQLE